jgi:hypothetical protein
MANIKDEFKKNIEEPLIKIFGNKDDMANRAKSLTESMFVLLQTPLTYLKTFIQDGWLFTICLWIFLILVIRISWKFVICPIYCFVLRTLCFGYRRGITQFDDKSYY